MVRQKNIVLSARNRGFHLITNEIIDQLGDLPQVGLLNLFIQHSSAGLTLNENCDPTVRTDFETVFNELVPENAPYYIHTAEGPDDMPAHIKSTLTGHSLTIPISDGKLALGTWQGIYFCEFRNQKRQRKILVSIYE